MNQDNDQSTQQPGMMPEWFRDAAPNPEPPRKNRLPKMAVVVLGGVLLLGACVAIGVLAFTPKSTCFDLADYKELTGATLSDSLSPTDNFYADYMEFKDATVSYDNSSDGGQHGDALLQKIADFYKAHPSKPMIITVSGVYFAPTDEALTNQRISAIESSLLKAGIPSSVIAVTGATYIAPEDEGGGGGSEVTLAITSDPSCK